MRTATATANAATATATAATADATATTAAPSRSCVRCVSLRTRNARPTYLHMGRCAGPGVNKCERKKKLRKKNVAEM